MKVTLSKPALKEITKLADKTTGSAASSITSHVMLTASPNLVVAMSTDLTAATRIGAIAKVDEDGAICLPADKLREIATKLDGYDDVTITADDRTVDDEGKPRTPRYTATITAKSYRANIKGLSPNDMPRMPSMNDLENEDGSTVITMTTPALQDAIKQVSAFVQTKNVSDPRMSGIAVTFLGNVVTLTATDGTRLCMRTIPVTGNLPPEKFALIAPKKQMNDFAALLSDSSEAIIGVTKAQNIMVLRVKSSHGSVKWVEIASQLIAGVYPDVMRIVPTSHNTRIVVDRAAFRDALDLALVLSNKHNMIRLDIDPAPEGKATGTVTISAQSEQDGDSEQTISAKVIGRGLEIHFSGTHLTQWLGLVGQDTIAIELTTPDKPGLLYPVGVDPKAYFYVAFSMLPKSEAEKEAAEEGSKKKGKKGAAAQATAAPAAAPAAPAAEAAPELDYMPDPDFENGGPGEDFMPEFDPDLMPELA